MDMTLSNPSCYYYNPNYFKFRWCHIKDNDLLKKTDKHYFSTNNKWFTLCHVYNFYDENNIYKNGCTWLQQELIITDYKKTYEIIYEIKK